ncbi:hypothetical protein [Photorhabdus bodei]|uniref:Uncharacterized protein n=1 Tax=Photorhabdus bodei TaxID=2029681 RepID=A0AAW6BPM9_9GAMM|nr:hypothetical protein [Photorhabdus bodei]MDB6373969.1 hypothetical protein [Photorhabdus bodei]
MLENIRQHNETREVSIDIILNLVSSLSLTRSESEGSDQEAGESEKIPIRQKDCIPDDLALSTIFPDLANARKFPVIKPGAETTFLKQNEDQKVPYVILSIWIILILKGNFSTT